MAKTMQAAIISSIMLLILSSLFSCKKGGSGLSDDKDTDRNESNDKINFDPIPTFRITTDAGSSTSPSLTWTGTEYGVSWQDDRDGNSEIYFARISSNGIKWGEDVRITTDGRQSRYPSLIWTGSEYGISWQDDRDGTPEIYFARISADGVKQGEDLRITIKAANNFWHSLVWLNSEYGALWDDYQDGKHRIYFARLSPEGIKQGTTLRITAEPTTSSSPALVWSGSEYLVSWYDQRRGMFETIFFVRLSSDGFRQNAILHTTNEHNDNPDKIWSGSEYRLIWQNYSDPDIVFYRLSTSKRDEDDSFFIRKTVDASTGTDPSLIWTGSGYGLSWQDDRDGNLEIYFTRISTGYKQYQGIQTYAPTMHYYPSLIWAGSEYGSNGHYELYWNRLHIRPNGPHSNGPHALVYPAPAREGTTMTRDEILRISDRFKKIKIEPYGSVEGRRNEGNFLFPIIENGMSIQEVRALLGEPSEIKSYPERKGQTEWIYQLDGFYNYWINVIFLNDEVVEKTIM